MTARDHDWRDDYALAACAFRLLRVDIDRRLGDNEDAKRQMAALTRRIIAAGYDADDALWGDPPDVYRREVRAFARALEGIGA